jgi:hypothetical protein
MRLKQQRKQVIDEAVAFLRQNNCCTDSDLPLARHKIESFYRRGETERPAPTPGAPRSPPTLPSHARPARDDLLIETATGA